MGAYTKSAELPVVPGIHAVLAPDLSLMAVQHSTTALEVSLVSLDPQASSLPVTRLGLNTHLSANTLALSADKLAVGGYVFGMQQGIPWLEAGGQRISSQPLPAGNALLVYDLQNARVTALPSQGAAVPANLCWSPSGQQLAWSGANRLHVFTESAPPEQRYQHLDLKHDIRQLAWSPDGNALAVTSDDPGFSLVRTDRLCLHPQHHLLAKQDPNFACWLDNDSVVVAHGSELQAVRTDSGKAFATWQETGPIADLLTSHDVILTRKVIPGNPEHPQLEWCRWTGAQGKLDAGTRFYDTMSGPSSLVTAGLHRGSLMWVERPNGTENLRCHRREIGLARVNPRVTPQGFDFSL